MRLVFFFISDLMIEIKKKLLCFFSGMIFFHCNEFFGTGLFFIKHFSNNYVIRFVVLSLCKQTNDQNMIKQLIHKEYLQ
jgi:hypothetical protein